MPVVRSSLAAEQVPLALAAPERFRVDGTVLPIDAGHLTLTLQPYELLRLDASG